MRASRVILLGVKIISSVLGALLLLIAAAGWAFMRQADAYQKDDRVATAPKLGAFVDAGDTRVFVQRLGDPRAPAVVFIHGTGSWSSAWQQSMQTAVKSGYQAVSIDMPPFGYSLPPISADYTKPAQARRLLAALDSMGIEKATFVAHSFGAAPVVEALMTRPSQADALVMVAGALGLDAPITDGKDSLVQALLRYKWVSEPLSAALLSNPSFTRTLVRSFASEKDSATQYWVSLYQQPLTLRGCYQEIAKWLPELVAGRADARSDNPLAYATLPFPVTLVWGETDTVTPLSQGQHLHDLIPGSTLVTIPRAGHVPQMEEAELFQSTLAQVLRATIINSP